MSNKGSNRKRTKRVNRSVITREEKQRCNTQEPKKEKKNTIVIVKNFNKMSIKNHNYLINYRQMNKHIYILVLALSLSILANAQQTPAPKQSKSILILNAKAHIGWKRRKH
jgi:hypothetical protein